MTLGDRIQEAIDDAEMTVQDLADALEAAGVGGGSYANLHRLKSDKLKRPSAELLHAIADAAEVDPTWLVTGEGEPTPQRQAAREDVEGVSRASVEAAADALRLHSTMELQRAVLTALGRGHPPVPEPPEGLETIGDLGSDSDPAVRWREAVERSFRSRRIHPWAAPLAEALRRLDVGSGTSLDDPVRFPLGGHERVGPADLGAALRGPLEALDLDPEIMGGDALDEYVLAALPALLSLARERRRQVDRRARAG